MTMTPNSETDISNIPYISALYQIWAGTYRDDAPKPTS